MAVDVWGYVSGKGQWKRQGNEAIGVCPACRGGQTGAKCLSVNLTTAQWVCNRKNNCGKSGGWSALRELYGDVQGKSVSWSSDGVFNQAPKKAYAKPRRTQGSLGDAGARFLAGRGLNDLTVAAWKCGQDNYPNLGECVTWPAFTPDGELANIKYRTVAGKDFRNSTGAQKLPIGIHTVKGFDRLILVEGELDAMSGYQFGLRNIISVPNGTGDSDWVEDLWPWLLQFRRIVVALDNDSAGSAAVRSLVKRLGPARCSGVTLPGGHKDLNDCLMAGVPSGAITDAFANDHEFPVADLRFVGGFLDELLAEKAKPNSRYGVMTGWNELDGAIRGFRDGELTVWSGYNGSGKSTVLAWLINQWSSIGVRSCVVSPELRPMQYLKWLAMQALGDDWEALTDAEIASWGRWIAPHCCLLNKGGSIDLPKLIEVYEYAANRYGCKMFVADNLMKINATGDPMEAQRRTVSALKDFAVDYGVHVHLVAHPRKPPANGTQMTKFDISGTSDIPNLADNVLIVNRIRQPSKLNGPVVPDVSTIKVDKNREHSLEPEFQIYVNEKSKGVFASGGKRDFRDAIFMDDDIPEWSDTVERRQA